MRGPPPSGYKAQCRIFAGKRTEMKFPFTIVVSIEVEVQSIVPDGSGNTEVTLSANGREAKCFYDAAGDNHGTLQDALLLLQGYRREEAGQKAWQPAPHASAPPQRVM
jgi:hypothetical protein